MISLLLAPGLILLFVLANGLFVAAEFAIVGAPRAALEHLAAAGHRRAKRVVAIIDSRRRRDRYIATTQIGVSLASLGLGMYGERIVATWIAGQLGAFTIGNWITANTIASVAAVAVLTYIHIVLGEMVPKTLALQGATRTALWVSPLIEGLQVPLLPVVRALNGIRNMVLRAAGVKGDVAEEEKYHTTEELQLIIQESQQSGLLRGEAGRILNELFEFGDLKAWQVMVPRVHVVSIPAKATMGMVRDIVRTRPHTRYPVC